jgi:hypothetical protein
LDSLAIEIDRAAKARRIRDQAWARYERRRRACLYVCEYQRRKWGKSVPQLHYRISIDHLRRAGFWHTNPRHPHHPRLYYEDMVHLEEQALLLIVRLDKMC